MERRASPPVPRTRADSALLLLPRPKSQPHLVRSLKPKLLIQGPPLIAGVQRHRRKALLLEPLQNRHHDPPRKPPTAKLRFRVHVQNDGPPEPRIFRTSRPRTEQNAAATNNAARPILRQPSPIRPIRQGLRKPRPRHRSHPFKFVSRAFPHIAEHRSTVMQDRRRVLRPCGPNRDLGQRHVLPRRRWSDGRPRPSLAQPRITVPRHCSKGTIKHSQSRRRAPLPVQDAARSQVDSCTK
jgi:hypothetical protein